MSETPPAGAAVLFPDKNVLIDAAELLADAWASCAGLAPVNPELLLPLLGGNATTAAAGLELLGRVELARQLRDGAVPLEMLRARAAGVTLAGLLADGVPGWLLAMIARSGDQRIQDLASHAGLGPDGAPRMAVTTDVMLESQMILTGKGYDVADATVLVQLLVSDAEVVELPCGLRKAVAQGQLSQMASRVGSAAPEHMAAIDWEDPYWRVDRAAVAHLAEPPAGKSWRQHKLDAYPLYGVDGEDLFLLWQVEHCAQVLGRPVTLATSDRHCALAALAAGVSSPVLYSRQGGRYVADRPGTAPDPARPPRVISVSGSAATAAVSPASLRPRTVGR